MSAAPVYSSWSRRIAAALIDLLIPAALLVVGFYYGDEPRPWAIGMVLGGLLFTLINTVFVQLKTGRTVGKKIFGIKWVVDGTDQPRGFGQMDPEPVLRLVRVGAEYHPSMGVQTESASWPSGSEAMTEWTRKWAWSVALVVFAVAVVLGLGVGWVSLGEFVSQAAGGALGLSVLAFIGRRMSKGKAEPGDPGQQKP